MYSRSAFSAAVILTVIASVMAAPTPDLGDNDSVPSESQPHYVLGPDVVSPNAHGNSMGMLQCVPNQPWLFDAN